MSHAKSKKVCYYVRVTNENKLNELLEKYPKESQTELFNTALQIGFSVIEKKNKEKEEK